MRSSTPAARSPWAWIPTLYLAEGLPYAVVMTVSVIMYKSLGVSNADIALYTSWLYLPWVIKPLWSPVVDILRTRRLWIWTLQLVVGAAFAGVALTIPAPHFFQYTLAFLWLLAFSSATHDIAADGFYMLATTEAEQSFFVGIRSTFYRLAAITGQGLLVILAGYIQSHTGLPKIIVTVEAKPGAALIQSLETPAFLEPERTGGLRILSSRDRIQLNPEAADLVGSNNLLLAARESNLRNGFRRDSGSVITEEKAPSWWKRNISGPLGDFLKRNFGPEIHAAGEQTGNMGVTALRLSRAPGRELVVTTDFKSGDKSVSLIEGSRLVFDDQNWDQPALLVFQLDPKLRSSTAARFEVRSGNIPLSWTIAFIVLAGLFLLFGIYHGLMLPRPATDRAGNADTVVAFLKEFFKTFGAFFAKERVGILLLFLLFYRFAEAQLVKMVAPFLLDSQQAGGLGLTTGQVGFVYGTIGIIALTCGGLLGGVLVSRHGLKFWLWPMVLIMHLPDAMFIYLAYAQPDNLLIINLCVAVEQFGYGFGFTAYMLYMIHIARGVHPTAHYAICTGFMALGMMLPGMWSGWLQEAIGYQHFFVWVMLATIPGFVVAALIPLDAGFGKKR